MNLKNNFLTIFYILLFTLYQISLVVKGGTTWDDEQLVNTSSRIINKFILFIDDPSNPFISEFVSNYEFYGYFVLIPIFLLSRNQFLSDLFSTLKGLGRPERTKIDMFCVFGGMIFKTLCLVDFC